MFNILGKIDKIAFSIGKFEVAWYAVIILSAIILSVLIGYYGFAKRLGMNDDILITGVTLAVVLCILGTRLYYVIFNSEGINSFWDIFNLRKGGLAIHGGIITLIIFLPIYCKVKKMKILTLIEIVIPLLMISQCIGRWGNFINQEAFGSLVPFSGELENNTLTAAQLLEQREYLSRLLIPDFIIDNMYIDTISSVAPTIGYYHPTFLYESVFNFIGFGLYMFLRRFVKQIKVGDGLCFYLVWYGALRFFIESLRTDALLFFNTGLKTAQLISILFIIVGVTLFILRRVFKFHMISCYDALYKEGATMMLEVPTEEEVDDREQKENKVVIFDCDGTILDTYKLIEQVVIKTFAEIQPEYDMTEEEAHTFFGPFLDETFANYYDTKEEIEHAVDVYRKYCDELTPEYVKAYDGIKEMLQELKDKNYKIAMVSNKITQAINMGLDLCGISDYFDLIVGADKLAYSKPHPDGIQQVMKHFDVDYSVLVGDTFIDMETADNAGITFIGVTWCVIKEDDFKSVGADYVVNKPDEIVKILDKLVEEGNL